VDSTTALRHHLAGLSAEQLARVLEQRPAMGRLRRPRSLMELATSLVNELTAVQALLRVTQPELQLLRAAVLLSERQEGLTQAEGTPCPSSAPPPANAPPPVPTTPSRWPGSCSGPPEAGRRPGPYFAGR
jgi:hypothetical protein